MSLVLFEGLAPGMILGGHVKAMLKLDTAGDALVFDDSGFAKQRKSSVGVKGQYSGTLGKWSRGQSS